MPLVAFFLVLLLVGGCAAPPTPVGPTTDPFLALLMAGDTLAANGRRTAAEEIYRRAAALRPADPTPYLRLADLYREWNRPREGLAVVEEAARLGAPPRQVEPLRVVFYADLGDWEAVLSHGAAALRYDPTDVQSQRRVAWAYVALGEIEEAEATYAALLAIDPADPLANERLGVLLALRDPDLALPHLRAAHTALASEMLSVVEQDGEPAFRLTQMGRVCLKHAEVPLAVLALEEAIALQPSYADAHALLGQALAMMGKENEALGHLERAVDLDPRSPLARTLLGLYYLDRGDPRRARSHLEAAYDLDPENPAVALHMARLYADLGWYEVVDVWLDEAMQLASDEPWVLEEVARFCLGRGLTERGAEAARLLTDAAPESAVAHDLLGWAFFLSGDLRQAEEHLLEAIRLDPGLASAYYHLGEVYAALGEDEKARTSFVRALDLPLDPAVRDRVGTLLEGP